MTTTSEKGQIIKYADIGVNFGNKKKYDYTPDEIVEYANEQGIHLMIAITNSMKELVLNLRLANKYKSVFP